MADLSTQRGGSYSLADVNDFLEAHGLPILVLKVDDAGGTDKLIDAYLGDRGGNVVPAALPGDRVTWGAFAGTVVDVSDGPRVVWDSDASEAGRYEPQLKITARPVYVPVKVTDATISLVGEVGRNGSATEAEVESPHA